jgi:hypothetical protein
MFAPRNLSFVGGPEGILLGYLDAEPSNRLVGSY